MQTTEPKSIFYIYFLIPLPDSTNWLLDFYYQTAYLLYIIKNVFKKITKMRSTTALPYFHSQKHKHTQVLNAFSIFTSACTLKTVRLVTLHRSLNVQELHSTGKIQIVANHMTAKIQKNI